MAWRFHHGRRLTPAEYQKAVVALQASLPPTPSRDQDRTARRAELELAIDYRLGLEFPKERRDELWAIQQEVEGRRVRLVLWNLVPRFLSGGVEGGSNRLATRLSRDFSKVLTPDELEAFLGDEPR